VVGNGLIPHDQRVQRVADLDDLAGPGRARAAVPGVLPKPRRPGSEGLAADVIEDRRPERRTVLNSHNVHRMTARQTRLPR
jgi:hypothetical protein